MAVNKKIKKIFIANRGEIARRVALTAQKLGVQTVALTDRKVTPAFLVGIVSEFIHVEAETTKIYLDANLMIQYAKASHCDAVHPGFGFLSENSEFAALVEREGLTWIGPRPGAIDAMASKALARSHAEKAGVPCLPGINGLDFSKGEGHALDSLDQFADKFGFPILIKASFGGGGKGMRIVHKKADLADNARRAASEALSSFGSGSLIVEKYLPSPRHVEVQVLADKHGTVCIIGDRDCSLQRRHQKILEEAPAPNIPVLLRNAMHTSAKELALAVGYDNAGTVEFLLDETNPQDIKFFFLEMNTRLQVEHTVSEEVYGLDLVEWQMRISQGERLPNEFSHLEPRGHSIEVRIYAEDPGTNFFPVPGPVRTFIPAIGRGIRWELGIDTVDEITTAFDPMISKLVCTAGDRKAALDLLTQTLERSQFAGPRNNIPFLIWLAKHPSVRERPVDTHFIGGHVEEALAWERAQRDRLEGYTQKLLTLLEEKNMGLWHAAAHELDAPPSVGSVTQSAFAKKEQNQTTGQSIDGIQITQKNVCWNPNDPRSVSRYGTGLVSSNEGSLKHFSFVSYSSPTLSEYWIGMEGHNWVRVDQRQGTDGPSSSSAHQADGMAAPVPGKVIDILITKGADVEAGQTMFILESMKMQFDVKAGCAGKIGDIHVSIGVQVAAGEKLGSWII